MNQNRRKKYWKAVAATALCLFAGSAMHTTAQAAEWNELYFTKEQASKEQIASVLLEAEGIRDLLPDYLLEPFEVWQQESGMVMTLSAEEEELSLFSLPAGLKGTYVLANVWNYVNVRKGPSTDDECVGKLYADAVAEIVDIEGDWTLISSGSVNGYVKSEFLLFGDEAEAAIKKKYKNQVLVTSNILNLRAGEGTDFAILRELKKGMYGEFLSESEEWVKVNVEGTVGYVSKQYVCISCDLQYAVSLEEEAAYLAEQKAKTEAEAVKKAKEKAAAEAALQKQKEEAAKTFALGTEIAEFAVQFVGNPYVWGGTSLTNGADCSGFVYAVYQEFGYTLVRSSKDQAACKAYKSVIPNTEYLQPGDLVFYSTGGVVDHVALYIGNGKVVQASTPKEGIIISKYNYRTPTSAKRVL